MLPNIYVAGANLSYTPKNPLDFDLFQVDYSQLLSGYGDLLTGAPSISVAPTGLSISNVSATVSGVVSFYASGGSNGVTYQVTVEVQTNLSPSGRVLNRTVILPVLNR